MRLNKTDRGVIIFTVITVAMVLSLLAYVIIENAKNSN